jgi:hypothetical protein
VSATRNFGYAFVERIAVLLVLVIAMAGCGARPDSALRKELDRLYAAQAWHFPIDSTVLKFIPIGTPEKQAVDTLSKAGLGQKRHDKESISDPRCPWQDPNPAAPRMPCPNPANKSDYYLTFEAGAGDWGLLLDDILCPDRCPRWFGGFRRWANSQGVLVLPVSGTHRAKATKSP